MTTDHSEGTDDLGHLGEGRSSSTAESSGGQSPAQQAAAQLAADVAIRESEALFRGAFEHTHVAMVMTDVENRFLRVNSALARLFSYSEAEMVGMTMADITHPDDVAESYAKREGLLAGQGDYFQVEKRYVDKHGHMFWGLTNVSLVRRADGRPYLYVGQIQDITDRKNLAAERDALLAHLQLQINRLPLAYVHLDADNRVNDWNPAAERDFGFSREEMLGIDPTERLVPPAARPHTRAIADRLRRGDMSAHSINDNTTKDGRIITCEWINTPCFGEDGQHSGNLCLARDITQQKRLEDQVRQSQKMEAIGRLAGGVAHDFNNLLTVISGYGELLLATLPAGESSHDLVKEIIAAGRRAAGLTRQLLTFSRQAVIEPKVLSLSALVEDLDKMLRRIIGEDVQLAVVSEPRVGAVKADPGQIEQLILNLVVNARDAMPQGGRITIEVRNADLDDTYVRDHLDAKPGTHVLLAVSDTGCGMDRPTLARMFEPFFTTKGEKGTGLGLATVHGIVKQSGGHVTAYSELGRGTTFKVYLPRVSEQLSWARSDLAKAVRPHGTETVLLTEDEDAVRSLARRILQECGYVILEARDGAEAVRLAEEHDGQIHLMVTDVIMPGLGGREAAVQVAARHPGIKILYLSGYTDDAVVRHGILQAEVAFLQKPFSATALAVKVRAVLDGEPS
jgi:two-component system cell cycle sensor histidine kinase/response regulator CckA